MIKCTNGTSHQHSTVEEVRACYGTVKKGHDGLPRVNGTGPVVTTATVPATEKQREYIMRLAAERKVVFLHPMHNADDDINPLGVTPIYVSMEALTKKRASTLIDELLAMPKAAPASHPDSSPAVTGKGAPTEGMHKVGDAIFKVQRAVHGSGHLYCKRLVPGDGYGSKASFEYAPGAMRLLSEATKMTLEEAKAFGALYGTCCVCGRTLTNETSIENGIGPVCAGKGEWA